MSAEKAIIDLLNNTSAITDVVSTGIYLNQVPVNVRPPYIMVRRITEDQKYLLNGASIIKVIDLEITSSATTAGQAMDLSNLITAALSLQTNTASGITAKTTFLTNTFTSFDPETQIHRVIQDFEVFYTTT